MIHRDSTAAFAGGKFSGESDNDDHRIEIWPGAWRGTARRHGYAGRLQRLSAVGNADHHRANHDDNATTDGVHDDQDDASGSAALI